MNFIMFIVCVFVLAGLDLAYNPSGDRWIGLLLFVFAECALQLLSMRTERVVIKSKRIQKVKPFNFRRNLVKTADGRVFWNVNDDFMLKFGAKKLQRELRPGKEYEIKSYRRLGWSNNYNILSAHEVKSSNRKKVVKKSK